ncbi:hypothetical protein Barb7_01667 [Bacteroidales bacterium Barb7]|nr:hypothetical protein Barb7_01667 [Bacteroidales bacterium Barb7]
MQAPKVEAEVIGSRSLIIVSDGKPPFIVQQRDGRQIEQRLALSRRRIQLQFPFFIDCKLLRIPFPRISGGNAGTGKRFRQLCRYTEWKQRTRE